MRALASYKTIVVHMAQAITKSTITIKAIPWGCFAWCIMTWCFFFCSCGAVEFDTDFTSKMNIVIRLSAESL